MPGTSFFIISGVMVEAALRSRASWIGLGFAVAFAVTSITIENWLPVAFTATALFWVIVVTPVRTAGEVSRAVFVAVLSASLALQSEPIGVRLAYVMRWDAELAGAVIAAVCVGLSFTVASSAQRDLRLMPFASIGAAALPAVLFPAAAIWAAAGVAFLTLRELRGPGALVVSSAAVAGAFASLLI